MWTIQAGHDDEFCELSNATSLRVRRPQDSGYKEMAMVFLALSGLQWLLSALASKMLGGVSPQQTCPVESAVGKVQAFYERAVRRKGEQRCCQAAGTIMDAIVVGLGKVYVW